jgi:hypothetical protein
MVLSMTSYTPSGMSPTGASQYGHGPEVFPATVIR